MDLQTCEQNPDTKNRSQSGSTSNYRNSAFSNVVRCSWRKSAVDLHYLTAGAGKFLTLCQRARLYSYFSVDFRLMRPKDR